jgi:8-oxo-dGTP pyrophosphatase MutT (NUDIX family)
MLTSSAALLVAVVAVIFKEGRVLAMCRAATKDAGAGIWETLSGRVEAGEQPLDAVKREILEESGLSVRIDPRPVDAYTAQRGDEPMVVIVYRADWVGGVVRLSLEHDTYRWCLPEELGALPMPERLVEAVRRAADYEHS